MRNKPIIIGITGSIGMGKSTVATMFKQLGAAVHDADAAVHGLYAQKQVVEIIGRFFPEAVKNDKIDRAELSRELASNPEKLHLLESLIHPLVQRERDIFINAEKSKARKIIVLDIPLLFESGAEEFCDYVVVVTAPYFLQHRRVMMRKGMTEAKFKAILARQIPDLQKQRLADFVIHTGLGKPHAMKQVKEIYSRWKKS